MPTSEKDNKEGSVHMSDKRRYMALDLVSYEIQETLDQALTDLESYAKDTEDTTKLRFSLAYIHQVSGSLTMIEYHSAALLAREIEGLLTFILTKPVSEESIVQAIDTAKGCIRDLSHHMLQVIETGEDNAKALLIPLNTIRTISQSTEDAFSLSDIFNPEIASDKAKQNQKPDINVNEFHGIVRKLRQHFQRCLVNVFKNSDIEKHYAVINKVVNALYKSSKNTASEPFWEAAFSITDYFDISQTPLSVDNKKALKVIDGQFKQLEDLGAKGLMNACPQQIFNSLLYSIAIAEQPTDLMKTISQRYQLSEALKPKHNDVDAIKSVTGLYQSLIEESRQTLAQIKDGIVDYVANDWDRRFIENTPSILKILSEKFNTTPFKQLQPICLALEDAIDSKVTMSKADNDWQQLELIADIISAADYYLECLAREEVKNLGGIIRGAYQKLEIIGYKILPDTCEIMPINQPAKMAPPSAGVSLDLADDIDEDIFDIFIEEAQEVLITLQKLIPRLSEDRENIELLTNIRRAWHTLKGSGRMVGAMQMGEFAWTIEDMLNKILEGNLSLTDNRLGVVKKATETLPFLISSLSNKETLDTLVLADIIEEVRKNLPHSNQGEQTQLNSQEFGKHNEETLPQTDQVDDELFDIFINEAEAHLGVLINYLDNSEPGSGDVQITQELQRAFHTLKGSSHMAGIEPVSLLVTPLEALIKDMNSFNVKADSEILSAFLTASSQLQETIAALKARKQVDLKKLEGFRDDLLTLHEKKIDSNANHIKNHYDILLTGAMEHLTLAADMFEIACQQRLTVEQKSVAVTSMYRLAEIARDNKVGTIAELAFLLAELYAGWSCETDDFLLIQDLALEAHEALDDLFDAFAAHQTLKPKQRLLTLLYTASYSHYAASVTDSDSLKTEIDSADKDILDIFVAEAVDLGEQLNAVCNDWFVERSEVENLTTIKHILHTLKGSARLAELASLADIMFAFEKLIESAELYSNFDQKFFMGMKYFQAQVTDNISLLIEASQDVNELPETKMPSVTDTDIGIVRGDEYSVTEIEAVKVVDGATQPGEALTMVANDSQPSLSIDESCQLQNLNEATDSMVPRKQSYQVDESESQTADHTAEPETVIIGDECSPDVQPLVAMPVRQITAQAVDWQQLSQECQQVDEEMLVFFVEEAGELIQQLDTALMAWNKESGERNSCLLIKRILHTLKGGARLTELSTLGDLTHEYESLIEVAEMVEAFDDDFFQKISNLPGILQQSLDIIEKGGEVPEHLTGKLEATIEIHKPQFIGHHEQIDVTDLDADLVELFIDEAEDQLEAIDICIADFIQDVTDQQPLEELKRLLHTLKGGARLAGIADIGNISHDYETYIIQAEREHRVDHDGFIDEIQGQSEKIQQHLEQIKKSFLQTDTEADDVELIKPQGVEDPLSQAAIDATKNFFSALNQEKRHQKKEPIKVSPVLLENLINLAGESSIGRSRIEEQVNDLNFSVDEMDSTVDRLHNQIRRLEIETEAQIVFRQEQVVSEGQENFDPLEMDRYTHMQQLSKSLIESASDLDDITETFSGKMRDLETLLLQQSRLNSELQEGLMSAQMVPFSRMIPRLRRIVRQTATELGKKVEFVVVNGEGEMDRTILEKMISPLEHMLRNAVDHGIESPEVRLEKGKSEQGIITLTLLREGGEIILTLQDDGAGVDIQAVRQTAEKRGLLSASAQLSDHEICQFILHSGFSTAAKVTQISGRGVGMDVVHSEIKQTGGSVEIDSNSQGSCFTIRLPFTVSVNRALMVCIGNDTYAIPLNTIEGIVRISPYELANYVGPDAPLFDYAGQSYHLCYLGTLLDKHQRMHLDRISQSVPVVLIRSNDYSFAVQVDRLLGSQEIVVKSLGPQFSMVEGLSGATVLGDGSVVVILDMQSLIRADITRGYSEQALQQASHQDSIDEEIDRQLCIMVVDDSVTVRKVTTRLLERQGITVVVAKDGLHAMSQLQEMDHLPHLMLLDIEMPRMDGFEVVNRVRHNDRLKGIAICMITSRTGDKHRQRALSLGANAYLGKPFQETELLETIADLTQGALN